MPRVRIWQPVGLATWLAAAPVWGVSLRGADDGFRLEFEPPDARVCVLFPPTETKLEDCAGVDVEMLRRLYLGGPPLGMALSVVRARSGYSLLYAPQRPAIRQTTQEYAAFARDAVSAARSAAPSAQRVLLKNPAVPYAVERVGRAQMIRVDLLFQSVPLGAEPPEVMEQTTYAVLGEHAVHCLYVLSSPDVVQTARRDVESALDRVEVQPVPSPGARVGRILGWAAGVGLFALALGIALVLLVIRFRNSKRVPAQRS